MHKTPLNHEPSTTFAAFAADSGSRRRHPGASSAPAQTTASIPCDAVSSAHSTANTSAPGSRRRREKRLRTLDFAIAFSVSAAAHLGLVLMPAETKKPVVASAPAPTAAVVEVIDLPPLDETPVDVAESETSEPQIAEFAPPMQADLPSLVTVDSFVQPMAPPTPGITADIGMMVVPTTVAVGQGGAVPKLFEIAELDRVPNRIRTGMLSYPQEFRRSRQEGDVLLLVVIDPTGRVRVDRVVESTHPEFTRAAVTAAEQSVYESPKKGGVAVSARYTLRVPFRLTDG